MTTELLETPKVPRRKKGDTTPPRDDVVVKVDRQAVRYARTVASFRGISLAEYISEILKPAALRDFDEMAKTKRAKQE